MKKAIYLNLNRLWARVFILFHRFWAISYLVLALVLITLIFLFAGQNLNDFFNLSNQVLWVAIGSFAVFIVAVKQSRSDLLLEKSKFIPFVVRNVKGGAFKFELGSGFVTKTMVSTPTSEVIDFKDILRIEVRNEGLATNITGYVLHQGYFYPLILIPEKRVVPIKNEENAAWAQTFESYTWAEKNYPLYLILDDNKKVKIKYNSSYYCVLFHDITGEPYFLEEDPSFIMSVRSLREKRPSYRRDFINWM